MRVKIYVLLADCLNCLMKHRVWWLFYPEQFTVKAHPDLYHSLNVLYNFFLNEHMECDPLQFGRIGSRSRVDPC